MAAFQEERRYTQSDAQSAAGCFIRALDALDSTRDHAVADLVQCTAYPSWQERRAMVKAAADVYGRDIIEDVKRKTKGDFKKGLWALLELAPARDAQWIHSSITGLLKKKDIAREILCTRTPMQLRAISDAYRVKHGSDMVQDVLGAFSGKERQFFERLLTGERSGEGGAVDQGRARMLAQALYEAGPAKWGTDEGTYIQILTSESVDTVRAVFGEYEKLYGQSLFTVMDKEFRGGFEKDMLMLSKFLVEPPKAFADIIHKGTKRLGTDEEGLIRAIVARKDIDLSDIKAVYEAQHGSLMDAVESETSGDFRSLLMAVVSSVK